MVCCLSSTRKGVNKIECFLLHLLCYVMFLCSILLPCFVYCDCWILDRVSATLRDYRSSLIVHCNFDYISLYALSMKGVNVKVEYICVYAYDITMYQYTRI